MLSCSRRSWKNNPTTFAYQWSRDGTSLAGFTGSTYRLETLDEGTLPLSPPLQSRQAVRGLFLPDHDRRSRWLRRADPTQGAFQASASKGQGHGRVVLDL
jgi:hypothetical protein